MIALSKNIYNEKGRIIFTISIELNEGSQHYPCLLNMTKIDTTNKDIDKNSFRGRYFHFSPTLHHETHLSISYREPIVEIWIVFLSILAGILGLFFIILSIILEKLFDNHIVQFGKESKFSYFF
jgi:hypothetical protein